MDVWIIGDTFLRDIFPMMQALRTSSAWSKDRNIPYMYCQFNVFYFFSSATLHITNVLAKFLNSVVKGFNRHEHLPCYILIIPDEDILLALNFTTYGISFMLGLCLTWLSKQIERLLESRVESLYQ